MSKYLSLSWWKTALRQRVSTRYHSLSFRPAVIQNTVEGQVLQFFIGDPTGKSWYDNNKTENLELRSIRDLLLQRPMNVYECGAHHGLTTILLSRWSGGNVAAFECLPSNVEILQKNLELNGCRNVTVVPKAVGSDGTVNIRKDSNSAVTLSKHGISVDSISLDTYARQQGEMPDLIKIDVEGFEIDVLAGATDILKSQPAISVEVHPEIMRRYKRKSGDIWKYIDRDAYEIWIQPDDTKPPSKYRGETLSARVHLFFRPKSWATFTSFARKMVAA
jgi:FkbM family methyltransferase